MVMRGDLQLPSQEEMTRIAAEDKLNWETRFGYDAIRVKGLVDFQIYCDGYFLFLPLSPYVSPPVSNSVSLPYTFISATSVFSKIDWRN